MHAGIVSNDLMRGDCTCQGKEDMLFINYSNGPAYNKLAITYMFMDCFEIKFLKVLKRFMDCFEIKFLKVLKRLLISMYLTRSSRIWLHPMSSSSRLVPKSTGSKKNCM